MEDKNKLRIRKKKKEKKYCKIYKITKITLGRTRNQNGDNKDCQKINSMGTMFIKSSRKTKIERA
jgi:hypothetical protein